MGMLSSIEHVVVLMLENRSFDNMLGKLYPKSADFNGLAGTETNLDSTGAPIQVWNRPGTDKTSMTIPDPDPGELWLDINEQILGPPLAPPPVATMSGFITNYERQRAKPAASYIGKNIMHYFTPEQVPVISRLARQFAVCDCWHASAPNQTWPNRFFAHTATAGGYENNSPPRFPYEMPTVFNLLEDRGTPNGWKIYFHDIPQSLTLARLWPHADHFRLYPEFQHDAKHGTLPAYAFLEPRYFADVGLPNDEHPPHVVTLGEQLIADVYNSLRASPQWTKTLLIITYDEHGGCFDHVEPPPAKPPSAIPSTPFNFDRYGIRVPAVIVSPYIKQSTVLRPPGNVPFDHTTIIATLRKRFALGPALTERDAVAPDLEAVLNLDAPSNLGPEHIDALPYVASPVELAIAQSVPLNDMQRSLVELAAHLPATTAVADFQAFISSHIDQLRAGVISAEVIANQDMVSAVALIKSRLGNLFKSL